jgi:sigma-B regulation protein RsbU (phosphoserine phosphatase)
MTGLELCQALKREMWFPYVILATGYSEAERMLEGVDAGVDDFLLKPIDVDQLEARLLAASRLLRAMRAVAGP